MKFSLKHAFIAITLLCGALSIESVGYRRAYYEMRGGIWLHMRCNVGISFTWPAGGGFSETYCSQFSISFGKRFWDFPVNYYFLQGKTHDRPSNNYGG